jgi:predicted Zn-dependent protease
MQSLPHLAFNLRHLQTAANLCGKFRGEQKGFRWIPSVRALPPGYLQRIHADGHGRSMNHLQRSLALDPKQAAVRGLLSEALEKLGRSDEALAEQQRAVNQDPYNPTLQRSLVLLLIYRKQYGDAQAAMRHYLEIFPQDALMQQMLAASKGEAQQH